MWTMTGNGTASNGSKEEDDDDDDDEEIDEEVSCGSPAEICDGAI